MPLLHETLSPVLPAHKYRSEFNGTSVFAAGTLVNVASIIARRGASVTFTQTGNTQGSSIGIYQLYELLASENSNILISGAPRLDVSNVTIKDASFIKGAVLNISADILALWDDGSITADTLGDPGVQQTSRPGQGLGAGNTNGAVVGGGGK